LEKRDPVPSVSLSRQPGWGATWFAYVPEPADECWGRQTIRDMAKQAYDSRKTQFADEILVIAALWVSGTGVWFGSSVQGPGRDRLPELAPTLAPRLWSEIDQRVFTGNNQTPNPSLFHAEDAAMFWYESNQGNHAQPHLYPFGTHMVVCGKRYITEVAGTREPCGGTGAGIKPSCYVVSRLIGVIIT
jgi:hypothetical protein